MYRLIIKNGKNRGNRFKIDRGTVFLGRDPECHIQLTDDPEISRKHAIIERTSSGTFVRDLGSLNQTVVNGQKIESQHLQSGDEIEIGDTRLVYQAIDPVRDGRSLSVPQLLTFGIVLLILLAEAGLLLSIPSLRDGVVSFANEQRAWHVDTDAPSTEPVALTEESLVDHQPLNDTGATPPPSPVESPHVSATDDEEVELLASLSKPVALESGANQDPHNVMKMREEMEGLREQIEVLATQQEETLTAMTETPRPSDEDPVLAKAKSMLEEALLEIDRHNLEQAEDHLARIQFLAPDFVPAYVERARLFEQRAMLREAEEQWTEVLNRTVGTPLYLEALAERTRLARTAMIQTTIEQSRAKRTSGEKKLPRRIRLRKVEAQKFSKNDEFDEMRLLRVRLKPKSGEKNIDYEDAKVVVAFFDRDVKTGKISPSRAVVPEEALRVEGYWEENEEKTVTAAYILPQSFRLDEEAEFGDRMRYYGYVVRVYYRNELQDEDSSPKSLVHLEHVVEAAFKSLLKET